MYRGQQGLSRSRRTHIDAIPEEGTVGCPHIVGNLSEDSACIGICMLIIQLQMIVLGS